jgi:hypothetical protein
MSEEGYPSGAQIPWWEKPGHYEPPPTGAKKEAIDLEERVNDLELCLKGNPTSKRWQELNAELTNKKGELLNKKRYLAGRTPQMESWADPLPG